MLAMLVVTVLLTVREEVTAVELAAPEKEVEALLISKKASLSLKKASDVLGLVVLMELRGNAQVPLT